VPSAGDQALPQRKTVGRDSDGASANPVLETAPIRRGIQLRAGQQTKNRRGFFSPSAAGQPLDSDECPRGRGVLFPRRHERDQSQECGRGGWRRRGVGRGRGPAGAEGMENEKGCPDGDVELGMELRGIKWVGV